MAIFNLAQVLTVMQPRMLCPIGEVYQILNFMTDEDLYTHQIPRAMRACEAAIQEQFPALATDSMMDAIVTMCDGLEGLETNEERFVVIGAWLREQEAIHGNEFDVQPLGYLESNPKEPLTELVEMMVEAKDRREEDTILVMSPEEIRQELRAVGISEERMDEAKRKMRERMESFQRAIASGQNDPVGEKQ